MDVEWRDRGLLWNTIPAFAWSGFASVCVLELRLGIVAKYQRSHMQCIHSHREGETLAIDWAPEFVVGSIPVHKYLYVMLIILASQYDVIWFHCVVRILCVAKLAESATGMCNDVRICATWKLNDPFFVLYIFLFLCALSLSLFPFPLSFLYAFSFSLGTCIGLNSLCPPSVNVSTYLLAT